MKRLIYVGQDDDISDLAGRLQSAEEGDEVALVVPAGATGFQTPLHLRLLRQLTAKRGGKVVVISSEARLQEQARGAGLTAYSSVAAYEGDVPLGPRRVGPQPGGPGSGAAGPGGLTGSATPATSPWAPPAPAGQWVPQQPGGASASPATGIGGSIAQGGPAPAPPGLGPAPFRQPWTPSGPGSDATGYQPAWGGAGTATAVAPPPARPAVPVAPPAPPGRGSGRGAPGPAGRVPARPRSRTPLYFVLIGIGLVGIVLFLVLTPAATVTITVGEQPLSVSPTIQGGTGAATAGQGNYIQTRVVSDTATEQFTATPTGSQSIAATAATGQETLTANPSVFPNGVELCAPPEPSSGCIMEFQTTGGTTFEDGKSVPVTLDPSATVPVQAVNSGSSGNVGVGAISQWVNDPCDGGLHSCPPGSITVINPQATTGGANAATETVASSTDIQGWQNQVSQICGQLTSQVDSALQQKAGQDQPAVDPTGGGKTIACTPSPNVTQATAGTQMAAGTVTVTTSAQETVYSPAAVRQVVIADLENPNPGGGQQGLPAGDALVPSGLTLSGMQVTQAASDGTIALSVTGTDFYRPARLDLSSLKSQMTGHNPGDVPGIVEQRVDNVQSVTVRESPFTLFFMPFFSSNITIIENYAAPAPPAAPSSST